MGPCLHAVALGGPLEVLELLTPIMAATVLILSLACEHLFTVLPASPYFSSYSHTALSLAIVLVGATLAFLMPPPLLQSPPLLQPPPLLVLGLPLTLLLAGLLQVWTEFCVIKETSALTFMIAGTCKEVVTVIVAVLVFGDRFGPVNGVGLAIVILGVLLYNWQKLQRSFQQSDETLLRRRGSQDEESLELEPLIIAKSSVSSPPAPLLIPGVTSAATPPSPHHTELGLRGAMADLGSAAAARIVAPPATTANGHDRLGPHASISRERIGSRENT
ncbi:hypothetical protein QJQ45_006072 [Haematococcus lacustris]|nr:hypothetical protein QJQ45_006072 [Haematococcus lacustris]